MKPKIVTGKELANILRDMISAIEAVDSFGGSIKYSAAEEPDTYEVTACYRIGNSEGQGGVRMIGS